MENLYIALIRAKEICPQEDWPTGLAVYYDLGSVSMATHETLSYCFLQQFSDGRIVVWSRDDCHLSPELVDEAIRLLDRRRREIDANLPDDWPHGIHPKMRHWAKRLFRLRYFEPDLRSVTAMLEQVRVGGMLDESQIANIKKIHQERGGVKGLRRRQHAQWRLMRLAKIELEPDDRKTVVGFTRFAKSADGLYKSNLRTITQMEEKYWRQRLEATKRRAELIAAMLE